MLIAIFGMYDIIRHLQLSKKVQKGDSSKIYWDCCLGVTIMLHPTPIPRQ